MLNASPLKATATCVFCSTFYSETRLYQAQIDSKNLATCINLNIKVPRYLVNVLQISKTIIYITRFHLSSITVSAHAFELIIYMYIYANQMLTDYVIMKK